MANRLRIDMHVHTRLSFDCLSDPDAVVRRAVKRGIDRVYITDHNEIDAALWLARRHPGRVIVGEEVKTRERVDVTGLYLRERIPAGTPALETCERIHDQGGVVYLPHPFAPGKGGRGAILRVIGAHVDAMEGFNARLHDDTLNERAMQWASNEDVPVGAGSDAHTLGEIGRAWVDVPAFDDSPRALLEALGRGRVRGRASSRLVHVASTWAKLMKRIGLAAPPVLGPDRTAEAA